MHQASVSLALGFKESCGGLWNVVVSNAQAVSHFLLELPGF